MTHCSRNIFGLVYNVDSSDIPCSNTTSGFSQCCGKGDQCFQDNICHFTDGEAGTSGYRVASCTDATGKDSSCQHACDNSIRSDIVYSEADSLWHCCKAYNDTKTVNCSIPTDNTFQAPAPENLMQFVSTSTSASTSTSTSTSMSAPLSTSPSSSSTQSSLTSNNVSSTPTPSSPPSNSGLSTGGKAGIGVGVPVGAICIFLLLIMIILMMKRQRRQQQEGNRGENPRGIQRSNGNA